MEATYEILNGAPRVRTELSIDQLEALIGGVLGLGPLKGAWEPLLEAAKELDTLGFPDPLMKVHGGLRRGV